MFEKSAALMAQGACGMVYGRNIYQHDNPKGVVAALMAMIHRGAAGDEAWEIYQRMAEPGLLLGLDAGNTVIKAVLFDLEGRPLAAAQRDGASHAPAPGHVERDIGGALEQRRRGGPRVPGQGRRRTRRRSAAVGCAGHGNGLYLLDADGAAAARDPVARHARRRACRGAASRRQRRAAARDLPAKALAVADADAARLDARGTAPEVYARCGTAFLCKDFVTFRLTGRRVSATSPTWRAPACCGCRTAVYDAGLLERYGLARRHRAAAEAPGPPTSSAA